jgi:hypothetical protein
MAKDMFDIPEPPQPDDPKRTKPTPEEQAMIDRFAQWVVLRSLTVPAIMALETTKPLNWIGSQMLLMAEPAAWAIEPMLKAFFKFNHEDYLRFQRLLEKRWSMEQIILSIEKFDSEAKIKDDEQKAIRKAERKKMKAEGKGKRGRFFRKLFGSERPEDLK